MHVMQAISQIKKKKTYVPYWWKDILALTKVNKSRVDKDIFLIKNTW